MLLIHWLVCAATLLLLTEIFRGVYVRSFPAALVAAAIVGFVNAVIGPIVKFLTFPLTLLTLGLFLLVVNGLMFLLAGRVYSGFRVQGFGTAFVASLVYTLITGAVMHLVRGG